MVSDYGIAAVAREVAGWRHASANLLQRASGSLNTVPSRQVVVGLNGSVVLRDDPVDDRQARVRCHDPWSRSGAETASPWRRSGMPRPLSADQDLETAVAPGGGDLDGSRRASVASMALSSRLISTRLICSASSQAVLHRRASMSRLDVDARFDAVVELQGLADDLRPGRLRSAAGAACGRSARTRRPSTSSRRPRA